MAKRFTDSTKWSNPWYRKLPSNYRDLWDYILDFCDHAGIWRADLELAGMVIGSDFTLEGVEDYFGDRVIQIKDDKWFIPSFISFQYGELSADSKTHKSVIQILNYNNIDLKSLTLCKGYPKGIHTLKDTDTDTDTDKDQAKDKEKEENFSEKFEQNFQAVPQPHPQSTPGESKPLGDVSKISELVSEWGKTLQHFKIQKDPKFDEINLSRLAARYGYENARLAILGSRLEQKTESFDPGANLSVSRLLTKPAIFEKLVNLGCQDKTKPTIRSTAHLK